MRTSAVVLGPVRWGVSDENTTAPPAGTSAATAPAGSCRHSHPRGSTYVWAIVPSRWNPGATIGQPLARVASVSASHTVRYCWGSTKA